VVDFAAQAAGVLIALSRTAEIEDHPHPEPGFLVSLRETELLVPELPVDQSLEARVQLVAQMGNLSTFSFTVSLGGVPAAEGRLSLAIPRQSR
jgi:predicted hotdog family 3-hydroxylacyl-ACP dehydratase